MKILVINAGSSSLKYQLLDMDNEHQLASGLIDRIGMEGSQSTIKTKNGKFENKLEIATHSKAIEVALADLTSKDYGVISSLDEIDAFGHRMIHGGEKYTKSVIVTEDILKDFESCIHLAPLHFPPNILGVKATMEVMPDRINVAVFDTAFHSTIPNYAFMYGIPMEFYNEHQIRKYGFHGSSHQFIAEETERLIGKGKRIISCHLGNGSSLCAIKDGKSIDTSMGLTPLEGLMMGTRCGDIDPTVVQEIMHIKNMNIEDTINFLNKKCGLLGVTGKTSDMRDVISNLNDPLKKLAFEMLVYKIVKYIGTYSAVLGGLDAIVFTGGIGENSAPTRKAIMKNLGYLGINFDEEKNDNLVGSDIELLSKEESSVKVYRLPTNEELVIARETLNLL